MSRQKKLDEHRPRSHRHSPSRTNPILFSKFCMSKTTRVHFPGKNNLKKPKNASNWEKAQLTLPVTSFILTAKGSSYEFPQYSANVAYVCKCRSKILESQEFQKADKSYLGVPGTCQSNVDSAHISQKPYAGIPAPLRNPSSDAREDYHIRLLPLKQDTPFWAAVMQCMFIL